jgi:hypothetical protein
MLKSTCRSLEIFSIDTDVQEILRTLQMEQSRQPSLFRGGLDNGSWDALPPDRFWFDT